VKAAGERGISTARPFANERATSAHLHCAEKKGYAGVALYYSRRKPQSVVTGFSAVKEFDAEGRFSRSQLRQAVGDFNVYLCPSGFSAGPPPARPSKFPFPSTKFFFHHLEKAAGLRSREGGMVILCGDWKHRAQGN